MVFTDTLVRVIGPPDADREYGASRGAAGAGGASYWRARRGDAGEVDLLSVALIQLFERFGRSPLIAAAVSRPEGGSLGSYVSSSRPGWASPLS
jgi:hypothetical protein